MFAVEIVTDPDALVSLECEWWNLWHEMDQASPFQAPGWLLPWIRHFAGDRLRCCIVRRSGRLAGILPMVAERYGNGEKLELCGSGISDYLDGLFAGQDRQSAMLTALEAVAAHGGNVTAIDLGNLRPGSALRQAGLPVDWIDQTGQACSVCPVLKLDPARTLDELVPRRTLKNWRYARRRAERDFAFKLRCAGPGDALECLEILRRLHGLRWALQDQTGVLENPIVWRFHRDAAPGLVEQGLLRLDVLYLDRQPAAALYGLVAKHRWHYYIGGFDPAYSKMSVGTLMVGLTIEHALEEGCNSFDFLRGPEPYKYRWGAEDETPTARRLIPPSR